MKWFANFLRWLLIGNSPGPAPVFVDYDERDEYESGKSAPDIDESVSDEIDVVDESTTAGEELEEAMIDWSMATYIGRTDLPRGIRNNNPGNIERGRSRWKGLVTASENQDPRFAQFQTYAYGLRAMIKLMFNYYHKHDLTNVLAMINRYAPHHENDTNAYAKFVADAMGVKPTEDFEWNKQNALNLIHAMVELENGTAEFNNQKLFDIAWDMV